MIFVVYVTPDRSECSNSTPRPLIQICSEKNLRLSNFSLTSNEQSYRTGLSLRLLVMAEIKDETLSNLMESIKDISIKDNVYYD